MPLDFGRGSSSSSLPPPSPSSSSAPSPRAARAPPPDVADCPSLLVGGQGGRRLQLLQQLQECP
eukprot:5030365-Pyramimonas_sp.AAC.1